MPGIGKIDAPLQGDLPRIINLKRRIEQNGISFNDSNDLKSKTHNFNLKDGTYASLRANYNTNEAGKNIIRSFDISFLNRIQHIGGLELSNIKGLRKVFPYIKDLTTTSKTLKILYFLFKIVR